MRADYWQGKRPVGIPDHIDPDQYTSVLSLFDQSCRKFCDRPAFSNMGVTLTYNDLNQLSDDFAAWLQTHTDLKPGDRFAVMLPNILQFPIVVFGALKAGLVLVNCNPFYTQRELTKQIKDSGARGVVFLNVLGDVVESILPDTELEHLIVTSLGDLHTVGKRLLINTVVRYLKRKVPKFDLPQAVPFTAVLEQGFSCQYQTVDIKPNDLALLQYTMGTTGISKGAMLSHRNLIANMLQVSALLSEPDEAGRAQFEDGREVIIAPLPLYHIYAFTAHCLCMVHQGNHNVLVADPRDTDAFISQLRQWNFTAFVGLNTLFVSLLDHKEFARLDFRHLKITLSGGTALNSSVSERWYSVTGCRIVEAYGLTEASPAVTINSISHPAIGTAGYPLPSTELRIVDELNHTLVEGEVGELCVRGPQVFAGYWQATDVTAMTLIDGWLHTGDIAYIDPEGLVHIVDRKKDMILVSGFNVYPNEIENVVSSHAKVAVCAAIGVPDKRAGEIVKLVVVPSDDSLSEDELLAWCRANLAGYKVPKIVEFRETLPLTPVGKILRRELKAELA